MTAPATRERTTLATIVLAVTGISVIGLLGSLIGHLAGLEGFDNGGESSTAGSTFWLMYFLAGVAALVLGVVTLAKSWGRGPASEQRAGRLAIAYAVLSVLLIIAVDTLD